LLFGLDPLRSHEWNILLAPLFVVSIENAEREESNPTLSGQPSILWFQPGVMGSPRATLPVFALLFV
jgi:hypothetical protein